MLADFEQLLKDNNLYFESRLCDLPNSCTTSEKVVLDFDKVKDEFYKRFRENENRMPKSADALLIKSEKAQLIFIELKDLTQFLKSLQGQQLTREESNDKFVLLFANQFQVDRKLIDSFALLFEIATEFKIDNQFYPYLLKKIDKRFYFVLKVSARDFVRTNLAFLASRNRYDYLIFNKVDFIRENLLNQILE